MWVSKEKYKELKEAQVSLRYAQQEVRDLVNDKRAMNSQFDANEADAQKWRARRARKEKVKRFAKAPDGGITVICDAGQFFYANAAGLERDPYGTGKVCDRKGRVIAEHRAVSGYYFGAKTKK